MNIRSNKRAAILILALWSLGFLAVLAVQIGLGTRQKITLLNRIEQRSKVSSVTEAGIKRAIAYLNGILLKSSYTYDPSSKKARHNNVSFFGSHDVGDGYVTVGYDEDYADQGSEFRWLGVIDEERKLNINFAGEENITRLIQLVMNWPDEQARALAQNILDWRQFGKSQVQGFYSDDYYANLEDPYPIKNDFFELPIELLLVKGVTAEIYAKLRPYFTVYGDGSVNINTASRSVLRALGVDNDVVSKIFALRKGPDGIEATADDHIFKYTYDIAIEVHHSQKLTPEQMAQINYLNLNQYLTINSFYYMINSRGILKDSGEELEIECVFDVTNNSIKFWHKK